MHFRAIRFIFGMFVATILLPGAGTAQITDVTGDAGLSGVTGTEGAAWGDYDGDGNFDLFVARKGLYQNNGNGTFTDVTGSVLLDPLSPNALGAAWGDYDNDGQLDLYVTEGGAGNPSNLYRNNGNNTMSDLGVAAGINAPQSTSASWGDYDNDGDIDLYVARFIADHILYQNNGDGTFTDVAPFAGVTNTGTDSRSAAFADYDNDGDLDLFVVNSINGTQKADALYQNNGDGTFTDVAPALGMDNTGDGVGAAWGDYDNDGDLDLYLAARGGETLYQNNGNGTFADVTGTAGVGERGAAPQWVDYDNHGDLDLSLMRGAGDDKNILYRSNGDDTFTNVAGDLGIDDAGASNGGAWADYDNDGDLDPYVSNGSNGDNRLFRNDISNGNNWLQIKLVGRRGNRSGIGASVKVITGGLSQFQVVNGGQNSQPALPLAFGLGTVATVDQITVTWSSGLVQTLNNVSINQRLTIAEPLLAALHIEDSFSRPGGSAVVGVRLTADGPVAGVQFAVQPEDDGQPTSLAPFIGVINNLETQGFTASVGPADSNGKRTVLLFSASGASIDPPNSLAFLNLVFEIDENISHGKRIDVKITDVTISDPASQPGTTNAGMGSILIGRPGDTAGGEQGDGDGIVSILDLIKLIKYIIGVLPDPSGFALFVADVNGDGNINVQDVDATVNQILGPPQVKTLATGPSMPVVVNLGEMQVRSGQTYMPVEMVTDGVVAGMQATLTYDPTRLQLGTPVASGHSEGMFVERHMTDGVMRFIVYSADGQHITPGNGPILFIPVTITEESISAPLLSLSEVMVVDAQAHMVEVQLQTDAVKLPSLPGTFSLGGNYPNPFNPSTVISYDVPQQTHLTLTVYNLLGQEVVRLVDSVVSPGRYQGSHGMEPMPGERL